MSSTMIVDRVVEYTSGMTFSVPMHSDNNMEQPAEAVIDS